ncbi:DnaB-like helicase C-terminal domain-containing protein [Tepidibacillus sp. HK-1]|uniref:DnaB-like helicase C-terminal domain-containing protein n=1 Tax=Tepidibacillus sp. HK-1 TaxID=1883407 RepID=UPI000853E329|nr:DnaB-like helicase C-terminal domain-containing protein [Tepidibacillus sp. HK-1]GBF11674.1 replicative DNA helicase [Tepidibacillus sp. HK-1]
MTFDQIMQRNISSNELLQMVQYYRGQLTQDALDYLKDRGIQSEIIEKFLIGFEKDMIGFQPNDKGFNGYFHNRIIFPLQTMEQDVVDLIGRSIDGREPKFKSLIGVEDVFFNEMALKQVDDVILCNSIFDVLSLEQAKLPSICMINSQLNDQLLTKMENKRVFICFGNDEIGRRETIRVAKWLESVIKELYIIHLPKGFKDVNDFFIRMKNPSDEFINIINKTLKESLLSPIAPDSSNLVLFQEEYIKRYNKKLSGIKTGFKALDELLVGGLQEGLYLVGGAVSVGKTTFLKQLTDQVATNVPVLYISWDMTSFELWVRSMSRFTGCSTQQIFSGQVPVQDIQLANQTYSTLAKNIWTLDANIHTSLEDIAIILNKILLQLHKKPVIIFDHLQRIHLKQGLSMPAHEQQLQVTYNLHHWSRQWGVPILLAATGKEENFPPELVASIDSYIHLEGNNNEENSLVTFELKKNRNGSIGKIQFSFNKTIGLFSEILKDAD